LNEQDDIFFFRYKKKQKIGGEKKVFTKPHRLMTWPWQKPTKTNQKNNLAVTVFPSYIHSRAPLLKFPWFVLAVDLHNTFLQDESAELHEHFW